MNWTEFFRKGSAERSVIPWDAEMTLPPEIAEPLCASLQRFQLGESGEGRMLLAAAENRGDRNYVAAAREFVNQEGFHARTLELLVRRFGGKPLDRHWSDRIFTLIRRAFGLRMELMTILCAEMVGAVYFRMLADGIADPALTAACDQIARDEAGHIAFHVDFFRGEFAPLPTLSRSVLRLAFEVTFQIAAFVVVVDHRRLFRVLDISPAEWVRECDSICARTLVAIFAPAWRGAFAPSTFQVGRVS